MTKYEHLCDVLYWQYFHLTEHSQSILEVNITAIKFQEQIEAETKLPQNHHNLHFDTTNLALGSSYKKEVFGMGVFYIIGITIQG